MAVNSKNKGNTFERTISKMFSSRFGTFLGIDVAFRRNLDSGSYFGGKNQNRVSTHNDEHTFFGDILCPSNFRFNIECKHYKKQPSLDGVLNGGVSDWDKWIAQAEQDSKNVDKHPLIIVKYNNADIFCLVPKSVIFDLRFDCVVYYKKYGIILLSDFLLKDDEIYFD